MATFLSIAIVPAAGRSVRMGTPKLLLPWGKSNVIETVLDAWQQSRAAEVVVVVHPDDARLAEICRARSVHVVVAESPPPDMKASVQLGLAFARERFSPSERDAWLLSPADAPTLSPQVIDLFLSQHEESPREILVPRHGDRRGHPALFPWPLADEVARLAPNEGVNALFARHAVREIPLPPELAARDVDTPEEYARLKGNL
ncbi:MAG: nucleotidyltransferase family protein [Planctomycetia bacterium]|nr:nucleotidyltransferase family protein [Planctomycetia bacterium]